MREFTDWVPIIIGLFLGAVIVVAIRTNGDNDIKTRNAELRSIISELEADRQEERRAE